LELRPPAPAHLNGNYQSKIKKKKLPVQFIALLSKCLKCLEKYLLWSTNMHGKTETTARTLTYSTKYSKIEQFQRLKEE